jgi:hypothetical protein
MQDKTTLQKKQRDERLRIRNLMKEIENEDNESGFSKSSPEQNESQLKENLLKKIYIEKDETQKEKKKIKEEKKKLDQEFLRLKLENSKLALEKANLKKEKDHLNKIGLNKKEKEYFENFLSIKINEKDLESIGLLWSKIKLSKELDFLTPQKRAIIFGKGVKEILLVDNETEITNYYKKGKTLDMNIAKLIRDCASSDSGGSGAMIGGSIKKDLKGSRKEIDKTDPIELFNIKLKTSGKTGIKHLTQSIRAAGYNVSSDFVNKIDSGEIDTGDYRKNCNQLVANLVWANADKFTKQERCFLYDLDISVINDIDSGRSFSYRPRKILRESKFGKRRSIGIKTNYNGRKKSLPFTEY